MGGKEKGQRLVIDKTYRCSCLLRHMEHFEHIRGDIQELLAHPALNGSCWNKGGRYRACTAVCKQLTRPVIPEVHQSGLSCSPPALPSEMPDSECSNTRRFMENNKVVSRQEQQNSTSVCVCAPKPALAPTNPSRHPDLALGLQWNITHSPKNTHFLHEEQALPCSPTTHS